MSPTSPPLRRRRQRQSGQCAAAHIEVSLSFACSFSFFMLCRVTSSIGRTPSSASRTLLSSSLWRWYRLRNSALLCISASTSFWFCSNISQPPLVQGTRTRRHGLSAVPLRSGTSYRGVAKWLGKSRRYLGLCIEGGAEIVGPCCGRHCQETSVRTTRASENRGSAFLCRDRCCHGLWPKWGPGKNGPLGS